MYQGNCLCGSVKYEIKSDLKTTVNCHCKFCSVAHGAAFTTLLLMQAQDFNVVSGEQYITKFHVENKNADRCFCSLCGTRLYNQLMPSGAIALVVATLQTCETLHPIAHCNTESKCNWFTINDDLPQFKQAPSQQELKNLL